nr:hypothetical protein [uncultured Psychroserpens sp.]
MIMKASLIIIGVIISLIGVFFSFSLLLYAAKERDDNATYFVIIPISLFIFGIYLIRKGIILKQDS